jgi:hypothetical protein
MTEFKSPADGQPELEGFPDVPEVDTSHERPHNTSGRPYRARYKDTTDIAFAEQQDALQITGDVPEEPLYIRKERQAFVNEAFNSHKSIGDYLADHPEKVEQARRLHLIE